MTLAELRTLLQAYGYGTDTATQQSALLNSAYRRICTRRAWSWLLADATTQVTPGVTDFTWTDFGISSQPPRRLDSLRLRDDTVSPATVDPLDFIEPRVWRQFRGGPGATWPVSERGTPRWWTRIAATGIGIWYPPDLAYSLDLTYYRPANVLTDPDEPLMPRDYHEAIVWEAVHSMGVRQRDPIIIGEARGERDFWIGQLEAEDNKAQAGTRERVSGQDIWLAMESR